MTHSHFSRLETGAALAIGTVALLMLGLQPLLLGAMLQARQVSLEGVGLVAMAEIVSIGLGVVLGDRWLPPMRLRAITVLAALVAAGFDLATLQARGDASLLALRAVAGLAQGVLVWGTTAIIVRSARPEHLGAVFFVVQTVAQAIVGAVLAQAVMPWAGWQGGFALLAGLALLPVALAGVQPAALRPLPPARQAGSGGSARAGLTWATVFLQLAAIGSFWAYLEPLALGAGLGAQAAQTLVSLTLVAQVAGGLVGLWAVRRLALGRALGTGLVSLAVLLGLLPMLPPARPALFTAACLLFGFLWLFLLPFHIGVAFLADASGRLASLVPAAQLLGSAFGPLCASALVHGDDARAVPALAAAFAVAAAACLGLVLRRRRGFTPLNLGRPS